MGICPSDVPVLSRMREGGLAIAMLERLGGDSKVEELAARAFCWQEITPMITKAELVHLVGDIDDAPLMEILALSPSVAEVEEAVLWAEGEGDELARSGHSLNGKAAIIYEILTADLEDESPRPAP